MAPAEQPGQAGHEPYTCLWNGHPRASQDCRAGTAARCPPCPSLEHQGHHQEPAAQTSTHHLLHEPPVPTLGGLHSQDLLLPCYR